MKSKSKSKRRADEPLVAPGEAPRPDKPPGAAELRALYRRLDAEVRRQEAVCLGGGACCRFDLTGQRLMLSTLELAYLSELPPPQPLSWRPERCCYQVGPRCTARDRRPLGCRVYFCDPALTCWCTKTYEKYHREIRAMHERLHIPYRYVELSAGLREIYLKDARLFLR